MARITGFLKRRFLRFRREAIVLWYAFRHPDTPRHLKVASVLLALYLLSPIDLIPIVIPFFGLLDDLIIVPLGVSMVVSRLPPAVHQQADADASRWIGRYVKRPLLFAVIALLVLVLIWVGLFWLLWWLIWA
ncbi:MAG: DUF1232 domain-containing protein [Alcanivorax sp.]|nr:DUF1232 domain-containing protein [Alcanivorax sp.]